MDSEGYSHPSKEAEYWNKQGIRHISGDGKSVNLELAESCFRKSIALGDQIASINLAILINKGVINSTNEDYEKLTSSLFDENNELYPKFLESILNIEDDSINPGKSFVNAYEKIKTQGLHNIISEYDLFEIIYVGLITKLRKEMEIKLKNRLKNKTDRDLNWINADELITLAYDKGIIGVNEKEAFDEFRKYANKQIHDKISIPDKIMLKKGSEYIKKI